MSLNARTIALASVLLSSAAHAQDWSTVTTPPDLNGPPPDVAPSPVAPDAPAVETLVAAPVDSATQSVVDTKLTPEELEQLGFGGSSPSVDTSLKLFGFADFTFATAPQKKSNSLRQLASPYSSFYVGNFNVYLSKNLSENVRTMAEVRFMYAPHGTQDAAGTYTIDEIRDPTDNSRAIHWGGISIQRIYLEWTIHPYLTVRAGEFLTPYGIWNVDHASPVFIPVQRPYVIGSQLFPEQQTGLEFFGQKELSTNGTLGYHFTISNGLGPITEIRDLDANKGLGGRLFWEYRRLGVLRIGGSIIYATDTSANRVENLDPQGKLVASEKISEQSKVLSMAADVQWKYKGIHLQAEAVTQQRRYNSHGRIAGVNPFNGTVIFPEDYLSWGVYGIAGYGFDVWKLNLMPYVMVQSFDQIDLSFVRTKVNGVALGFNIRPIDAVVVKLSYQYSKLPDFPFRDHVSQLLQAQIAWAF